MLDALAAALQPGDIVADGGNSYWGDSVRRAERLSESGLRFVDLGTSGGVEGARRGACFMAGGEAAAVQALEPILRRMAVDGGYVHAGPSGAGHFTKLVHNGIEFGMLEAIGEGLQLLERYPQPLPIKDVLAAWRHGSVIRSWLIDLMESAYRHEGGLDAVPPLVEDTGEVNWLVADALQMEVPVPVIALAAMQLAASRDRGKQWARAIAMMRKGFGGHPYGPDESIAEERRTSRVAAGAVSPTRWRSTSATLHACAMQPRGSYGGSASKISAIDPTPKSSRWASSGCSQRRASSAGWHLCHASIQGPISQAHTVPWW
jgi:6-phosphogluconate dehydrogenase